ncbi:MAG TPA: glycosyltransferase family 2 protein [Duganella sp.]|uniref:glycosyltransferase family 2 protein n=1 Tax=Duganella sp. TaxID=1904440 RepID=UPI002ED1717A
MPLHSVIMPVYNGEAYLAATIDSILQQTCADLELIIVDDCATDGSADIAAAYAARDARVRVVSTAVNSGAPALPKNVGLSLARGRYVSFCDQDDLLLPDKLEQATRVLQQYPDMDIVFADFEPFGDTQHAQGGYLAHKGFTTKARAYLVPLEDGLYRCQNFWGCMAGLHTGMSTQTIVCRREIIVGQRFDVRYRILDDIAMWYRFAETARIGFLDRTVARYRYHDAALTTNDELLARESLAFHKENYFRQSHLFNVAENKRYRRMLADFLISVASRPHLTKLEQRAHLAQSLVFELRLSTLRWMLQTYA